MQFSPVGHYFASASHDRTARIWSMDRIQPLRIMAGHLSDVDVSYEVLYSFVLLLSDLTLTSHNSISSNDLGSGNSSICDKGMLTSCILLFSVCNGMSTATTLLLAPVIKQFDYGTCRVGSVSGFSSAIGVWFCLWQCLLTVAIWHLVMKMAQSWCGTSPVAAASHLWSATPHVSGHLLSGDPLLSL